MGIEGPNTVRESYSRRRIAAREETPLQTTEPMLAPEVAETFKKVVARWQSNPSVRELLYTVSGSEGFRNLDPKLQSIALYYIGGRSKTLSTDTRETLSLAMKRMDYQHQEVGVQERLLREFLHEQRNLDWTVALPKELPLERQDYKILKVHSVKHEFRYGLKPALAYEVQFGTQKINVIVPESYPGAKENFKNSKLYAPLTLGEILEGLAHTPGEFRSVITKVVNEGKFEKVIPGEKHANMDAGSAGAVRIYGYRSERREVRALVRTFMHEAGHILTLRAWGTERDRLSEDWRKYKNYKSQSFNLAPSEYPRDKEWGTDYEDAAELGVHNYIERKLGTESEVKEIFPGRAEMIARIQAPVWNEPHKPRDQLIRQYALESLSGKQMQNMVDFLQREDNALKYGSEISQFITDSRFNELNKSSQNNVLKFLKMTPDLEGIRLNLALQIIGKKSFSSIPGEIQRLALGKLANSQGWALDSQLLDSENFAKLNFRTQKLLIDSLNADIGTSLKIAGLGKSKGFRLLSPQLQAQVLKHVTSTKEASNSIEYGLDREDFKLVPVKLHRELISRLTEAKELGYDAYKVTELYANKNFNALSEKTRADCVATITKVKSSYFIKDIITSDAFKSASKESQSLILTKITTGQLSNDQIYALHDVLREESKIGKLAIEAQKVFLDLVLSNKDNYDLRSLAKQSGLANFSHEQQLRFVTEFAKQLGNSNAEKNLLAMSSGPLFPTLSGNLQDKLFANLANGKEAEYTLRSLFSDPAIQKLSQPVKELLAKSSLTLTGTELSSLVYIAKDQKFASLSPQSQASFVEEYTINPNYSLQRIIDIEGFKLVSKKVQKEIFEMLGSRSLKNERKQRNLSSEISRFFDDENFVKLKESRQLEMLKVLFERQMPQ